MRTTLLVRVFNFFNKHKASDYRSTPKLSSSVNETELALQVMREKSMIMSATNVENQGEFHNETPLLQRKWVQAPLSRLSTTVSRRDWFRMMQLNFMTDCWNDLSLANSNAKYCTKEEKNAATTKNAISTEQVCESYKTTPVCGVRLCNEHNGIENDNNNNNNNDNEEACSRQNWNDCQVDKSTGLPYYISPEYRQRYLLTLLRQYDPDVVTLNEVNRLFFHHYLWRHVRELGYGMLYNSSRGARVKISSRRHELYNTARDNVKPSKDSSTEKASNRFEYIIPEEDIGNAIFFHKGRFCPILMPGEELPRHLYFAQFVSLRDRVTNMTLNIALVQFTAGKSNEAAALRTNEARQTLMVLDSINRNDSDRAHMSNIVCGDFNNEEMDEECVKLMQERFFSAYDLVGGPRWTTWHFNDEEKSEKYVQKYYDRNVQEWKLNNLVKSKETEIENYLKNRNLVIKSYMPNTNVVQIENEKLTNNWSRKLSPTRVQNNGNQVDKSVISELATQEINQRKQICNENSAEVSNIIINKQNIEHNVITKYDAMELIKEEEMKRGVIKRTQDYIFHEPFTLALHGVLDIPETNSISQSQLLPNAKSPSHHIPLVIDVSFNNIHPEVTDLSMKP